jgi:PHD/YefM family antitoxin component YafN of YafNO toxin-antitoxin module
MSIHYIVDESGERLSIILPMAEYEALLERATTTEDETAYLLRSSENARILRERLQDVRQGRTLEKELLPDEDQISCQNDKTPAS